MSQLSEQILNELQSLGNHEKVTILSRFFKTGPGEYGENDIFIGVTLPEQRKIVAQYHKEIAFSDISDLLDSIYHEARLTGVLLLIKKGTHKEQQSDAVDLYLKKKHRINNWDLVDCSAPYLTGEYFFNHDRTALFQLVHSESIWDIRIAVMTTFYFIRKLDFADTLKMADILLQHKHDLIQKAVGWMLREIGNRDMNVETDFLKTRYTKMPRTMFRYAIEKFPEDLRKAYLNGKVL